MIGHKPDIEVTDEMIEEEQQEKREKDERKVYIERRMYVKRVELLDKDCKR